MIDVLVLGGTGMLGHKVFQTVREQIADTWCTIRGSVSHPVLSRIPLFQQGNVLEGVQAEDMAAMRELIYSVKPRVVVNCVGIIKQRCEAKAAIPSITINSLLPHQLAEWTRAWGGKLIHFSTDCVFSGDRGGYKEEDFADARDLYGRSKYMGEVATENALTLRTSIIGRELSQFQSLLEWLLKQRGKKISGYTRAMYSGVTTNYLAELVTKIILEQPKLSGLYQVTSETISKFDLLCLLREAYGVEVEIEPEAEFFCDRSMRGEKFVQATGYRCPAWPELVRQLADDPTEYEQWRTN